MDGNATLCRLTATGRWPALGSLWVFFVDGATMRDIRTDVLGDCEPQVIEGLLLSDYLALRALSGSSVVHGHRKSMLHLRHDYEYESATTDAMILGAAADCLLFDVLVPAIRAGRSMAAALEEFDEAWPLWTGGRRYGKAWDEFQEHHGDQYLRNEDDRDRVIQMTTRIATDPVARPYWEQGVAQSTIVTSEHGIRLKHRPDWIAHRAIVDMKTTQDISRVHGTVRGFGYQIKMAMYRLALKRCTGNELPCVLIFVEQKPPHDVVVMPLDVATLGIYEEIALDILKRLRVCIEQDHWPGVANGQEMMYEPSYGEMDELAWEETE